MYKKASSELVVARRRRGADNGRQHVRVAAADRVQGPLGEDETQSDISAAEEFRPRVVSRETARTVNNVDKALVAVAPV